MTPEGRIKKQIKLLLDNHSHLGIYKYMPVPSGYGATTLDYLLCVHGLFVAIEAKAPGKEPTLRQRFTIAAIQDAGGVVFMIDGEGGLEELRVFLEGFG